MPPIRDDETHSDFTGWFVIVAARYLGYVFLGSQARPLLDWPLDKMSQAPRLKITEMRAVGDDWRVTAIPLPAPGV